MFAVTDIETTGVKPWSNEILTLCTIVLDENLDEVDRFNANIKPNYESQWTYEAEQVHGISLKDARLFRTPSVVLNEFVRFLSSFQGPLCFTCHAFPFKSRIDLFDYQFVFSWFWVNEKRTKFYELFGDEYCHSTIIRSKNEAKALWGVENQKLETWAEKLGWDYSRAHNAEFDTELTCEVLRYQMKQTELFGEGKRNRSPNNSLFMGQKNSLLEK